MNLLHHIKNKILKNSSSYSYSLKKTLLIILLTLFISCQRKTSIVYHPVYRDTIIYHIKYVDSLVYRYDTVQLRVQHAFKVDTLTNPNLNAMIPVAKKKNRIAINTNNLGIGPSFGVYYSPYNGFDINVGFGVQYYFLSIPSIKRPHLKRKSKR